MLTLDIGLAIAEKSKTESERAGSPPNQFKLQTNKPQKQKVAIPSDSHFLTEWS
jgi:hypothetical protein